MVDSDKVTGIFDLDNTTTNKFTTDFLNQKQKEGKKRMKQVGRVEIPQEAFMAVLQLDD